MKGTILPAAAKPSSGTGLVEEVVDDAEPAPPTPAEAMNAAVLFLRRNFRAILPVFAGLAVVLFGVGFLFLAKYSATALVALDPRAANVTRDTGVLSNIGPDSNAVDSIVQIARTDGFLGALVDSLGLVHDPFFGGKGATDEIARAATIDRLRRNLNVGRIGTTYLIEVTVASPSAETSAKVANAAAQAIIAGQRELRTGTSEKTEKEIEDRLAELRARVDQAEHAAADLKAKLNVTDAGQGSTLLERRVFELNQQLVLASAKTADARARFDMLRKAGADAGDNLPASLQSPVLNALRIEYANLLRQSADQASVLGSQHPELASLRAQLADVKRQISAEIARLTTAARTDYLGAEQAQASLAAQLKEAQDQSNELGVQLVTLAEREREAKAERAIYEELLDRQRALAETKGLEPNDIRLVSAAMPPTKTTPSRTSLAAAAAAIGLAAGLAYAFLRETMNRALKTPRQAERMLGLEVLGLVPFVPAKAAAAEKAGPPPDISPWLADLSAAVMEIGSPSTGRIVLVASAQRGEGRSTLSINLAAYLARAGERVLLIEADRPQSKAHGRQRLGLIDILERGEDLPSAIVEQSTGGYSLLPFGGRTVKGSPPVDALMSGMTLQAALRLCRQWFDVVVIDGPPALNSGYARLLARQADTTAFVIEWNKTDRQSVTQALERLDAADVALIFNKVDVDHFRLFDPAQSQRLATPAADFAAAA